MGTNMDPQSIAIAVTLALLDVIRGVAECSFYVVGTLAFVRFLRHKE